MRILGWILVMAGIGLYGLGQVIPAVVSILFALGGMLVGGVGAYLLFAAAEKKKGLEGRAGRS